MVQDYKKVSYMSFIISGQLQTSIIIKTPRRSLAHPLYRVLFGDEAWTKKWFDSAKVKPPEGSLSAELESVRAQACDGGFSMSLNLVTP